MLERGRKLQMQSLITHVNQAVPTTAALIVAGDFNDWQKKASDPLSENLAVRECGVARSGKHLPTFPSWRPFLSLDRVYVRRFQVVDHQVLYGLPWRRMSDHAAVMVELELSPAAGG